MSVTSEDEEASDRVPLPTSHHSRMASSPEEGSSTYHSDSHSNSHTHSSSDYDDDDLNEDDEEDDNNNRHPLPPFTQHTFAPPFYGRPPTPLPPSPSLTSLLRPSRPTTPDASDDDGSGLGPHPSSHHHSSSHLSNSHHPSSSADHHHQHHPVPRASPKVPTYEYYGFVLYLFSGLCFLIYLLWSYLPSPFLHALGIYYYPNRWWAVAVPSFLVMAVVYIYVALAAYNTEILTLPLGSVETIVDDAAMVAVVDSRGRIRKGGGGGGGGGGDGGEKGAKRKGSGKKKGKGGHHGGGNGGNHKVRDDGRERRRNAVERERERERRRDVMLPNGGLNWREVWNEGTDACMDIPLGGVCEVLYGEGRDGGNLDEYSEDEAEFITRL